MKNLWGDRYYSNKEKKWSGSAKDDTYTRGFTQYILDPIYKVNYNNKKHLETKIVEFVPLNDHFTPVLHV